jgi:hypothetical protein
MNRPTQKAGDNCEQSEVARSPGHLAMCFREVQHLRAPILHLGQLAENHNPAMNPSASDDERRRK